MDIRPDPAAAATTAARRTTESAASTQTLGEPGTRLSARVLSVSAEPPDAGAPSAPPAYRILVSLPGQAEPVALRLQGSALPAALTPGSTLLLQVLGGQGLQLLDNGIPPPTGPGRIPPVAASLATWLPLQSPLQNTLSQIAAALSDPTGLDPAVDREALRLLQTLIRVALPLASLRDLPAFRQTLQASASPLESALLQAAGRLAPPPASGPTASASLTPGWLAPLLTSPPAAGGTPVAPAGAAPTANVPASVTAASEQTVTSSGPSTLARLLLQALAPSGASSRTSVNAPGPAVAGYSPTASGPSSVSGSAPTESASGPGALKGLALLVLDRLIGQSPASAPSTTAVTTPPGQWPETLRQLALQPDPTAPLTHPLLFPSPAPARARESSRSDTDTLIKALVQMLSRVHVNQLNALQQNQSTAPDVAVVQPNVWLAELPIQSDRHHAVQMRFERDPQGESAEDREPRYRWTVVLGFEFEELGHLQTRLQYMDGAVSAVWWAERPATLQALNQHLPTLREGLRQWGLQVGELDVRQGKPPTPARTIDRRMIDERA